MAYLPVSGRESGDVRYRSPRDGDAAGWHASSSACLFESPRLCRAPVFPIQLSCFCLYVADATRFPLLRATSPQTSAHRPRRAPVAPQPAWRHVSHRRSSARLRRGHGRRSRPSCQTCNAIEFCVPRAAQKTNARLTHLQHWPPPQHRSELVPSRPYSSPRIRTSPASRPRKNSVTPVAPPVQGSPRTDRRRDRSRPR